MTEGGDLGASGAASVLEAEGVNASAPSDDALARTLTFGAEDARRQLTVLFLVPGAPPGLIEVAHDFQTAKGAWVLAGKERFVNTAEGVEQAVAFAGRMSRKGSRVYFGAGLRRLNLPADKSSKDEDIIAWTALCWDCDDLKSAEAALRKAKEIGLSFDLILQTGEQMDGKPDLRIQIWVRLAEPCSDMARIRAVLTAGISVFGSDPSVKDPRRIMRLAGSVAWSRKIGRVTEPTRLRDDLLDGGGSAHQLDDVEKILRCAVRATQPGPEVPIRSVNARVAVAGGEASIWSDAPAADEHLQSFLAGVEMHPSAVALAYMASRRGEDAETVLRHLQALLDLSAVWQSRPGRGEELRAGELKRIVEAAAGDCALPDAQAHMFREFAWCESLGCAVELATGALLDRTPFEARNYDVGSVGTNKGAWYVFLRDGRRRRNVAGLTFRPGGGRIVVENLPGLNGECVNTWLPPARVLPASVSDDEVKPYLELVAFVIPDADERETVLDWMAWNAQNPGLKPSYAIVLGSTHEGVGKDTIIQPLLVAVGVEYVSQVGADVLIKNFNGHIGGTKLLVVQEMENFSRRETNNLLKPLIAAPPDTLLVDEKYVKPHHVPNVLACIFMTNEPGALKIGDGDRRYFVSWNRERPQTPEYYDRVWAWLKDGGAEKAAAWLLARDVSAFAAKSPAPWTQAKDDMRRAARPPLEQWVEERIADEAEPFDTDIVCLQYVCERAAKLANGGKPIPPDKMAALLRALGGVQLGERMRLGWTLPIINTDRGRLFAVRRTEMYADVLEAQGPDKIKSLFESQSSRARGWGASPDAAHDFASAA